MVSRIAVIPARGGSKRIPKKNILEFSGKPMIAWTIEAALNSGRFDRVVVSTEDREIAEVAIKFGAEVPFLRDRFFDDQSTVSEAVCDALIKIQTDMAIEFDQIVQLMANCPIRNSDDICRAIDFFELGEHDFQISCFEFGWMNPWWAVKLDENKKPTPLFPAALKTRSQDLEKLYCPTGAIWIANAKEFVREKTFYGSEFKFFPMPWCSAVDIDDYGDLEMAKAVMNMVMNENRNSH